MKTEALIREYVQQLLKEDEYGDVAMGDTVTPYGMHYGSGQDLYNVFVKPFADVVGVAAGKTKELSEKGQTLIKVAFEAIATSLIPILEDSYSEIFAQEKEQLNKIRQEYAQVYQATWDAFDNTDVLVAAFMYKPSLFLTAKLAKQAPQATAKLLSVLSGGKLDKVLSRFNVSKPSKKRGGEGPGVPMESVLREDTEQHTPIEKLASHKKVREIVASNDLTKKMEKEGQAIVRKTLHGVYQHASSVLQAKSLFELQKKLGKKLPGFEKIAQVPAEERKNAEQALLVATKKTIKEFYVKNLKAQIEAAVKAGVPSEHPFVKDYEKVAAKISSL